MCRKFSTGDNRSGIHYSCRSADSRKTEWHNIVLWRGLAEIAEKYVRKGTQLYIEGKIRTRSWVDQSNITRYTTEIYADNMELLGRKTNKSGRLRFLKSIILCNRH